MFLPPPRLATRTSEPAFPGFTAWLKTVSPELTWDVKHLNHVRKSLARVTRGEVRKLAISWPAQHWKTWSTTVRYPLYRMLRTPGLRVGVGTYNQRYANKVSRWTRRLVEHLGIPFGDSAAVDSWTLANGSSYIARGAGVGLAGEPVDLWVCDDPFKNREQADSPVVQEKVWEWHMDDVTPRVQQGGACIVIHTRWHPGDLIGRILESEDGPNWEYVRLPALAEENDPIGRAVGEALCPQAFSAESLADKKRVLGIGFESIYQQNPIPRGGTFFERGWFTTADEVPSRPPLKPPRRVRYWDLAASRKDSACYTAGVLMAKQADTYYVEDVIRGRWNPAERNAIMRQTAEGDKGRVGFERTYFECPVFDTGKEAKRAVLASMSGLPVWADSVSGSKEVRAEPLADAARGGLIRLIAAPWNAAYLTELEGFPKAQYKDQVDSSSGAFNKLAGSLLPAAAFAGR